MCLRNEKKLCGHNREITAYKILGRVSVYSFEDYRGYKFVTHCKLSKSLFEPINVFGKEKYELKKLYEIESPSNGFHAFLNLNDAKSYYYNDYPFVDEGVIVEIKMSHLMTKGYYFNFKSVTGRYMTIEKIVVSGGTFIDLCKRYFFRLIFNK